jgi:hypothetical protein
MQFCEPLQRYLRTTKAVIHMEHRPAEQTFTDYAGDKLYYYYPASGAAIACPVFISVLFFRLRLYIGPAKSALRTDAAGDGPPKYSLYFNILIYCI